MDSEVLYPAEVKVSKLRYSTVKTLNSGARLVYVNYGDEKLTIQTPLMILPYGISDGMYAGQGGAAGGGAAGGAGGRAGGDADGGENKRYDVSLSFRDMENNPKIKAFYDKMSEIEKKIMDDAFANRQAWLRDDFDGMKPIVNKLMNPIIRLDRDKETGKVTNKYPPTMKIKLPYDSRLEAFTFDAMDMERNEVDFKAIMGKLKGTKAVLVIQLTGLYFAGGKYGCMWKVVTGMFQKGSERKKATIRPDSDVEDAAREDAGDDDDVDGDDAPAPVVTGGGKVAAALAAVTLSDSDEDDGAAAGPSGAGAAAESDEESEEIEESEEEEPAPPPPPPKKKTAAAKKAAK